MKSQEEAPEITGYTPETANRDRTGGGAITYVKETIKFTKTKTLPVRDEAQLVKLKLHLKPKISVNISNIYFTPKHLPVEQDDAIIRRYLTDAMRDDSIVVGDINAHSSTWYSQDETDHRGELIEELVDQSESTVINDDSKPTRIPFNRGNNNNAEPTSPDITIIPANLVLHTKWETCTKLSSDHLPIMITVNSGTEIKKHNRTFINYKKANWEKFTEYIENKIEDTEETEDPHKLNKIIVEAIREADKIYVPRGNIKSKTNPMPEHIRTKITERNELRSRDPNNVEITILNDEIKNDIRRYKQELWQDKINSNNWDHKTNATNYWSTMKLLQGKRQTQATNRTIEFKNKISTTNQQIANSFNKQYTGICPKSTDKDRRKTLRKVKKMQKEETVITEQEVLTAIKEAPPKKSSGPDDVTTLHMKHLGNRAIQLLAKLYNNSINTNTIPQSWKTAKIVPLPKPKKDKNQGKSYRPISLISNIAKTMERVILKRIEPHLPKKDYQHGYKVKHSTTTALQHITNKIASGFNKSRPPKRTIMIAIDMSRAFDVIDHHLLIKKRINLTTMPPIYIKYISNYIQGRKAYTVFNGTRSSQSTFHGGVPQGGVLSPALFNLFMADMPEPDTEKGQGLDVYADDVTLLSSHEKTKTAIANAQQYLDLIIAWMDENNLILADKTQAALLTPDPAEQNYLTSENISNKQKLKLKELSSSLRHCQGRTGGNTRRPSPARTRPIRVQSLNTHVLSGPP